MHSSLQKVSFIARNSPSVFCAVDTADISVAQNLAAVLSRTGCGIKLGLEFFNAQGPQGVRSVRDKFSNLPLFLDLKFHDIPNTVAQSVRGVVPLAPAYINVHAAGGVEMMKAAKQAALEAADRLGVAPPRVLAVTILTSLDDEALERVGQKGPMADQVERLAVLTRVAGLDGVVCSAHEISRLRKVCGDDFVLMVPGIRPADGGTGNQDQKRVMTPAQAMRAGATHLVIGRPITQATEPEKMIRAILDEITAKQEEVV